jgi:hypothetical protein
VATTGLLWQPQKIGDGDCAVIGGTKSGRGNRSTLRKSVVAPFCPTHDQTPVAAVGSRRRIHVAEDKGPMTEFCEKTIMSSRVRGNGNFFGH